MQYTVMKREFLTDM